MPGRIIFPIQKLHTLFIYITQRSCPLTKLRGEGKLKNKYFIFMANEVPQPICV